MSCKMSCVLLPSAVGGYRVGKSECCCWEIQRCLSAARSGDCCDMESSFFQVYIRESSMCVRVHVERVERREESARSQPDKGLWPPSTKTPD